ncbi:hypothetical protein E4T56_gene3708 [Termitomyces sp. T112]|nr:hypothetical protein E4T56_gene3708 [Termitomyces sp. T112]
MAFNSNDPILVVSRPVPQNPAHRPSTPRTPKGTPNAPPNFHPCPAPTSANSDASPANSDASPANSDASPANSDASPANSNASLANSDGPLANFGACPAATDTYPGPPEPREPPPLFPIFATHHQLNTLVPPTYFGVSRQPWGNPRSPMIPSTYQRGTILDHNRHPPPPSSSAKPRRHSRRTPKSSGSQSEPRSLLGPRLHQLQMISHQTLAPFPLITQPPTPLLPRISRTAFCLNPAKTVSFPHNLTSPDLPGSVWITSPQLPARATMAQNVFECSGTSARGSRPPSKDSPSAAEPPGSAEPDK